MATPRGIIGKALRDLRVTAPGENADADALSMGLDALQDLTLEVHEGRGPLLDVDVTADCVPGENQRIRVQAGFTVNVTLPNSIPLFNQPDPYDYGFSAPSLYPPIGSTGEADGQSYRQPRDGARIEVVGETTGLFFYRADLNQWMSAYGLSPDAESPFNGRLTGPLAALLAERLADPLGVAPPPGLAQRIVRARLALMLMPGTAREPVLADYL